MTRSTARLLVAMVLASSTQATGCGREPLLVEESPPVTVRITPHHPARTPARDSLLLAATANASDGRAVRLGSDAFVWTSADPLAVAMRPRPLDGRRAAVLATAGSAAASTWVFVEVSGVGRDSVQVEVFVPSETTLRIQLLYAPDVPPRWRTFLESAALRWEWAMAGELPEVQLDSPGGDCPTAPGEPTSPPLAGAERGVRIYVGTSGRFPAGTYVEAVGGPCIQRPLPTPTTIVGAITINRDHPANGIDFQRLEYLVAHEMGHALGLVAVVNGEQPAWYDPQTRTYRGAMALEGWRRVSGDAVDVLGELGAHWSLPGFTDDVMATGGGGCACAITLVSIGGLLDLGYPAVWREAGRLRSSPE
jgi:hypothetical protein